MSANKKPRKAYRPRRMAYDNMQVAMSRAAVTHPADRKQILAILSSALKALREGVATEMQWAIASGSVTLALAIERQGVVRNLKAHLDAANDALNVIRARAMQTGVWTRTSLYFNELDALRDFYTLHTFQINNLSRAEFLAALNAAERDTLAQGYQPVVVHGADMERLAA